MPDKLKKQPDSDQAVRSEEETEVLLNEEVEDLDDTTSNKVRMQIVNVNCLNRRIGSS